MALDKWDIFISTEVKLQHHFWSAYLYFSLIHKGFHVAEIYHLPCIILYKYVYNQLQSYLFILTCNVFMCQISHYVPAKDCDIILQKKMKLSILICSWRPHTTLLQKYPTLYIFLKNLVNLNEVCLHEVILNLYMHAWIFSCLSIASVDGKQHLSVVVLSAPVGFS